MDKEPKSSSLVGKNRRPCPVLNAGISPADCGAQRGSRLNCPAGCAFYPLGTASEEPWNRVDTSWCSKVTRYLTARLGQEEVGNLMRRLTIETNDQEVDREIAFLNAIYHGLLLRRNAAGQTLAEQWEAEGWAGLNNDERVMMRYRRNVLPTVLQVRKVLDSRSMRCVDLLAPDSPPFVLWSPGAAAKVARFSRILTWLAHYPYFSRLDALAFDIHPVIWPLWHAQFEQQFLQAASAQPGLTPKLHLAGKIVECSELLFALAREHRERVDQADKDIQYSASLREWLVTPLSALHGLSPSAAAIDLGERPKLAELVQLYLGAWERQNLTPQGVPDTDWVLDELHLPELK